jgi:hypothetical protein
MECDIPDHRPVLHWLPELLHLCIVCTPRRFQFDRRDML